MSFLSESELMQMLRRYTSSDIASVACSAWARNMSDWPIGGQSEIVKY